MYLSLNFRTIFETHSHFLTLLDRASNNTSFTGSTWMYVHAIVSHHFKMFLHIRGPFRTQSNIFDKVFCENSEQFSAINRFCKKHHFRCLTKFRMHICIYPIKCQSCPHIETSQLICCANQFNGFFKGQHWHLKGMIFEVFGSLWVSL